MDTTDQLDHATTNGFTNGTIGADEKELEELLFGNLKETWDKTGYELSEAESGSADEDDDQANEGHDNLFFFDTGPSFVVDSEPAPQMKSEDVSMEDAFSEDDEVHESDEEKEEEEEEEEDTLEYEYNRKPAWVDDDDARIQVSLASTNRLRKMRKNEDEDIVSGVVYERRLRKQFAKMYPKPEWAMLPSEKRSEKRKRRGSVLLSSDESDGEYDATLDTDLGHEERIELLQSTYGILDQRRRAKLLPTDHLDIVRQKNANQMAPTTDFLTTVAFHPNAHVLLTGGADKHLRLFQIDGRENPKIQSIRFKDMKPLTAQWNPSGDKIYAAGMRKFYYIYDVQSGVVDRCLSVFDEEDTALRNFRISPCGQYVAFTLQGGHIGLASTLTKEWVGDLKMNGSVDSIAWSSNSKYIYGAGSAGSVYQFDVGQRECVKQWDDDGAVNNTCIQMSPNDQYLATGSSSGYVNLYNRKGLFSEANPKPFKSFGHLTTRANIIKFNHDSQLMAIASASKNKELKMVHLPSGRVFPNWPTERSPIKRVQDIDFSPNSDYVAIALHNGRCLLYTLKHYAL